MNEAACVAFLGWALPRLQLSPPGFRRVRGQVCKRIGRRLKALGLGGLDEYRGYLEQHPDEWGVLDGMCRVSVSRFYRDATVFDHIRDRVLPDLARAAQQRGAGSLNVWSAGCAAGEEPYTLLLAWRFAVAANFPGVDLRIVATDADPHALERARAGCYRPSSVKELPRPWLQAFQPRNGLLCLDPALRQQVDFRHHDLREPPPEGPFDLVLCRNLLFTYFEEPLRTQVAQRLIARLIPEGVLMIGAREQLDHTRARADSGCAGGSRMFHRSVWLTFVRPDAFGEDEPGSSQDCMWNLPNDEERGPGRAQTPPARYSGIRDPSRERQQNADHCPAEHCNRRGARATSG